MSQEIQSLMAVATALVGMQCDSQLSVLLRNKTAKLHFHINRRLLRESASKIILNFPLKSWSEPPWEFLMSRYRVGSARCCQNGQIKYFPWLIVKLNHKLLHCLWCFKKSKIILELDIYEYDFIEKLVSNILVMLSRKG